MISWLSQSSPVPPGHFIELPGLRCTELPQHPLGSKGDRWSDDLELDARSGECTESIPLTNRTLNNHQRPSKTIRYHKKSNKMDIIGQQMPKFILALSW
jgi:hypothetical protein